MKKTGEPGTQKDTYVPSTGGNASSAPPSSPVASSVPTDQAAGVLFDRATGPGQTLWQLFLDHTYTCSMPSAGPDGTLYSISGGGYASAVKDGKVLWECNLEHHYGGSKDDNSDEFKRGSSPVIDRDSTVYSISHGGYATAVKEGKILWECGLQHNYEGSSAVLSPDSTIISLSAGGYLTSTRGSFPRLDAQEAQSPGETAEKSQVHLEDEYIIVDGIKLPVNRK